MIKLKYNEEYITIVEYQEAKKKIMQLSDQFAGDVTAVSRGGNRRNTIFYYNYPCSFDIETTTIKPGELDYLGTEEDPPLAFPYLFQFNICGTVFFVRRYPEAMDIFRWISEYFRLGSNRRMIFFIHNLGYEYTFFRDLWDIVGEKSFALDEHHPVTIITEDGFMFRDSYKMSNMSLELLSKDWSAKYIKLKEIMDYSKLRTPYSALDDDTMLYSALDVLALSDAISHFLAARGEPIWTRSPTSTGFLRMRLKKDTGIGVKHRSEEQRAYQRFLADQKITYDMYRMLRRLARGGNTHTNRFITGQLLTDLLHYDITSSYPSQMVCYPEYPVGFWSALSPGTDIEDIELFERTGYCCMMDIALINARLKPGIPVPYIPISKMTIIEGEGMQRTDNGRYLGGLKAIGISIFGIEWDIIKRQYDFDDAIVLRGYFCRKGYLPDIVRRFVLDLYSKKTELKGIPEKAAEYMVSKADCNSVFGMAFTDVIRSKCQFEDIDIIMKAEEDPAGALEKYQNSIGYFLPYAAGAMTACLGRVMLQRLVDACVMPDGSSAFCYCDTDSIFAIKSAELEKKIEDLNTELTQYQRQCGFDLTYYDIKGKPHELGSIDREKDCQKFISYGAKKYATVEDDIFTLTVAGVPKKAGAKLLGSIENFKLGFNFRGAETGKNCLWYNPDPGRVLHDEEGREIEIHSNVAMLPCDYLLSMSADYLECLSIEGNFHWNFKEAAKNVINEEDYV